MDEGPPLPAAGAPFSPWADTAPTAPTTAENAEGDLMASKAGLQVPVESYARGRDPRGSPSARAVDGEAELKDGEGVFQVWPLVADAPQVRAAVERTGAFLRARWPDGA